jgi:hypothetical protein
MHKRDFFYGRPILRNVEQEYIEKKLEKYKDEQVTEELKQKIWDELQMDKHLGKITIPFKVVMRRDTSGKFPEYIEIILDTKL